MRRLSGFLSWFWIILIFVAAVVVWAHVLLGEPFFFQLEASEKEEFLQQLSGFESENEATYRPGYLRLNEQERQIYAKIAGAIMNGTYKASFSDCTFDVDFNLLDRSFSAYYSDYPEYFWLEYGYQYYFNRLVGESKIGSVVLKTRDFWEYSADKNGKYETLLREAEKLAQSAAAYDTVYESIEFVHNHLVASTVYDKNAADYEGTDLPAAFEYAHTAYGCLVNHKAVCDGYAKAFQLVMNLLDVECEYIEGTAGGAHAWNLLKIDGEEYWMDVTWDDLDFTTHPDEAAFDYFCITDKQMFVTHTPDENFSFAQCDAVEYNFHVRNGFFLTKYTFSEFEKIINLQKGKNAFHVRFATQEEYLKAYQDLFEDNRVFDVEVLPADSGSVRFVANEKALTLLFLREKSA